MKKDCCQSRKKVTKVPQPKKAPKLPKSNDDEQKPKNGQVMKKRPLQNQEKLKRSHSLSKH